jgi:hypothetical protein
MIDQNGERRRPGSRGAPYSAVNAPGDHAVEHDAIAGSREPVSLITRKFDHSHQPRSTAHHCAVRHRCIGRDTGAAQSANDDTGSVVSTLTRLMKALAEAPSDGLIKMPPSMLGKVLSDPLSVM